MGQCWWRTSRPRAKVGVLNNCTCYCWRLQCADDAAVAVQELVIQLQMPAFILPHAGDGVMYPSPLRTA